METKLIQRRYDLDWLRVLAFSGVFLYHCSRFFNQSDWHIKNATTSPLVDLFTSIFDLWGMPLIFAISGASIFFALRNGGAIRFLRERALRLLVPMALGILVLAPPQVYLDRLTHGKFNGSFFEFIPHFFEFSNFAWNGRPPLVSGVSIYANPAIDARFHLVEATLRSARPRVSEPVFTADGSHLPLGSTHRFAGHRTGPIRDHEARPVGSIPAPGHVPPTPALRLHYLCR